MKSFGSPADNVTWALAASRLADELRMVGYDRSRLPDPQRRKLETLAAKLSIILPYTREGGHQISKAFRTETGGVLNLSQNQIKIPKS